MAFLCGSSSAALALADSRSKENVLLTSANEQLMLAKSQLATANAQLESEVQRLESEVQRLESEVQRLVQMDKPMTIEELDTNNKDELIAALEKKIEALDDTYSLGWAETSQTNADLSKANADLTKANADLSKANADLSKENEELRQILARARLEKVSGDEVIERNVAAMEETIDSMQAEIYELHYFLGSKGYKARMLHAEGIRIPDEDAHAWWGFSACTRRNEDGTYSFFAHPDEEKTRPANMVNPNYGKQIRRYIRTY
jgi:cob(I)alamin adenosyltransferase